MKQKEQNAGTEKDAGSHLAPRTPPDAIAVLTAEGEVQSVNDTLAEMMAREPEEVCGKNPFAYGRQQQYDAIRQAVNAGRCWQGVFTHTAGDGLDRDLEATISPVCGERGTIKNIVSVCRDITDEGRLDACLRRAEHFDEENQAAGVVARDLNSLLTAISAYTELSLRAADQESPLHGYLTRAGQAAVRAKELVRKVMQVNRRQDLHTAAVRVDQVVREALDYVCATMPQQIKVRRSIACAESFVRADPWLVRQLVVELCADARADMAPEGGFMAVSLSEVCVTHDDVMVDLPDLFPGAHVRLTLYHTSSTIRTGMSLVRKISRMLNGCVQIAVDPGQGSSVSVYLPLIDSGPERCVGERPNATEQKHILVIDDNDVVSSITGTMIEQIGHRVTIWASSRQSHAAYRDMLGDVDYILMDAAVLQQAGERMLTELRKITERIPIVVAVADRPGSEEDAASLGFNSVIRKPFNIADIRAVLSRCVGDDCGAGKRGQ
ncbi:MAG: PAS domain-containing protein [Deltaproteobacteria bacterium]|nr:PAS domain-containing protein [Deltaproteobacteria bacterium]